MKDKKAAQVEAKEKHKAEMQAAKARRRGEPLLERSAPKRIEKPTILIVCEGKNTEPSYFNQFKLTSATVKAIGNGNNTISLVNQAIALNGNGDYDQIWCVFDKDSFPAQNFNNAIAVAEANGFGVAYSNQSFEYWLLLHFEDHQGGAMNRSEYEGKINGYLEALGCSYDGKGSKTITDKFFETLMGKDDFHKKSRIDLAIVRAENGYNKWSHQSPAIEESTTTVFKLVKEILKYL